MYTEVYKAVYTFSRIRAKTLGGSYLGQKKLKQKLKNGENGAHGRGGRQQRSPIFHRKNRRDPKQFGQVGNRLSGNRCWWVDVVGGLRLVGFGG